MHLCRFFVFNDTATTEIYTLSLHDALPIYPDGPAPYFTVVAAGRPGSEVVMWDDVKTAASEVLGRDRKSTRLNSSHANISYAVFCLKKKTTARQSHPLHNTLYDSTYAHIVV